MHTIGSSQVPTSFLNPNDVNNAINQLILAGISAGAEKKYEEAEKAYLAVLQISPNNTSALTNLSLIYADQQKFDLAVALGARACCIAPEETLILSNTGNIFYRSGRYDQALDLFDKVKVLNPEQMGLDHNLALVYFALGDVRKAIVHADAYHNKWPDRKDILSDRGMFKLATGDYPSAWADYENRWRNLDKCEIFTCGIKQWQGEDIKGKRLLIHHEQGYGDTIQFMRFLPHLMVKGAELTFCIPQSLIRLVEYAGAADHFIPWEETEKIEAKDYNLHAPLLDVPQFLNLQLEELPGIIPYLFPPPDNVPVITKPMGAKLSVGLVWAGRPGLEPDLKRSMPVTHFLDLAILPEIQFYSFQVGTRSVEFEYLKGLAQDLSPFIRDWADSAALLNQMDVVISVDTSTVHLAGALNKKTFALLPYAKCWRWLEGRRSDSPWYPNMTLIQQEYPGDWSSCMRVAKQLLLEML